MTKFPERRHLLFLDWTGGHANIGRYRKRFTLSIRPGQNGLCPFMLFAKLCVTFFLQPCTDDSGCQLGTNGVRTVDLQIRLGMDKG